MSNNYKVLVDRFVSEVKAGLDITKFKDDHHAIAYAFEKFSAQCVLKRYNLSDEEIESGITGGGDDGALDCIYTFLDDTLVGPDHDAFSADFISDSVRKGANLELHLIQAKQETSFKEAPYDLASSSLNRLLQYSAQTDQLSTYYSDEVISRVRLFYELWELLGTRFPNVKLYFHYSAKGDIANANRKVIGKAEDLREQLTDLVPGSTAFTPMLGARELWKIASVAPDYTLQMRFFDYVTGDSSYSGLVSLADYYSFITDESTNLRGHLFDWNVRDYEGSVTVNKEMSQSLGSDDSADFWWLNNGVTILCSDLSIGSNKTFTLDKVQIVNGLQTSHTIHGALSQKGRPSPADRTRYVQVKVIQTSDEATRDRIIRATNSQTKVPDSSLHATEEIHRQIESHFHSHGWFYDRRKNFYKNQGKHSSRIVSISTLGQAVMAMGLGRPNDARTRPTSLLNIKADYETIFNGKIPLDLYLWLAIRQRTVDSAVSRLSGAFQKTNYKFHVSLYLATYELGQEIFNPGQLKSLTKTPTSVSDEDITRALNAIETAASNLVTDESTLEKVSKTRELVTKTVNAALNASAAAKLAE